MSDQDRSTPLESVVEEARWYLAHRRVESMPPEVHIPVSVLTRVTARLGELEAVLEEAHLFLCYITEENTDARNDVALLVSLGERLSQALSTQPHQAR